MTRRYYAPDLTSSGGLIHLSDEEASHAARVMRAQVGEEIVVFDGNGNESHATIVSIDKRNCAVDASGAVAIDREPECKMHLGIAFPKPERAKEMIERLTELGVNRITPIICQRTQRPPTDSLLAKLRRIVIESSKQCQRNALMTIDAPMPLDTFIADQSDGVRWIAHPDVRSIGIAAAENATIKQASILIGPEGGFNDDEVELAVDSGYEKVGLGPRTYRIETAACVIAARLSAQ